MKIFQIVLIAIFLGCNSQQNSNDLLITAANTLNVNAENYKLNSLNTLSDFEGLIDPYSFQPVDLNYQRARKVRLQVEQLDSIIKAEISMINENNYPASRGLELSSILFDELSRFTSYIHQPDSNLSFTNDSSLIHSKLLSSIHPDQSLQTIYKLKDKSSITLLLYLSNIRSELRRIENNLVKFYFNASASSNCIPDKSLPIILQNTNVLKPGEVLEIRAGLGSYRMANKTEYMVDGKSITVGDDRLLVHKILADNVPGKKKIQVSMHYINPETGSPLQYTKTLSYEVVQ
jgi:hypothetical protein